MYGKIFLALLTFIILINCSGPGLISSTDKPLQGIKITLDPGHGDTEAYDDFRVGPTGEREEWINLRVAKILGKKLKSAGASVLLTRTKDKDLSLGGRAALAIRHQSDLLVSIHHNGSKSDLEMDLPIVYFYGPASLNPASVDFARLLISGMRGKMTFEQALSGAVYSDHLIYSSGTSILRNTIEQMPGVIGEGGFFTHPKGENRLKSQHYNELEAEVYFEAILAYVERGLPTATPMVADIQTSLNLEQEIEFRLDDGHGSTAFDTSSFLVLQDGDTLVSSWNASRGILKAQPMPGENDKLTFQVFGRNTYGNALHPKPFTFATEQGARRINYKTWQSAFDRAEQIRTEIVAWDSATGIHDPALLDEAVRLYRLSLEIQPVHARARIAEEQILALLEMKQALAGEGQDDEIELQRRRVLEYYPD